MSHDSPPSDIKKCRHPFWGFNIGHVITIVLIIIAAYTSYIQQQYQVKDLEKRVSRLEESRSLESTRFSEAHEKIFAAINEINQKLGVMRNDLQWMKEKRTN